MSAVGQLYRVIIDDVVKNVKAEFNAEGLDDSVLQELQTIWEMKLQQSGAVNLTLGDNIDYSNTSFAYDLSSVYSGTPFMPGTPFPDITQNSMYNISTPPTYMSAPPLEMPAGGPSTTTTATTHVRTTHAHAHVQQYNQAAVSTAANALHALNATTAHNNTHHNTLGKPQQYMAPNSWAPPGSSSNPAGSIQNILRQQDGAGDSSSTDDVISASDDVISASDDVTTTTRHVDELVLKKYEEILKKKAQKKKRTSPPPGVSVISQVDGNSDAESGDDDDDGDSGAGGDDELDSDLDDEDDAEPETENFVLCQYEKVTRIKNKRKTNLKDGIMHLNGRDAVFHKATGEFDW